MLISKKRKEKVMAIAVLLAGLVFFVISASATLTPSPVLLEGNIMQCGCNNSAFKALKPAGQGLVQEIILTGFFSFDRDDSKPLCSAKQPLFTTGHLVPAAYIALDEINNSSDILPGYQLSLDLRDSRCDSIHTISEFVDTIDDRIGSTGPPLNSLNLGILGPGCDSVADSLAGVVNRSLKLPLVSYAPNLPTQLSFRSEKDSSQLFHISRSVLLTTQSAIGLMHHFGWTNNTAFVSEDFFLSAIENVVSTDSDDNIVLNKDGNGAVSVSEFVQFETGQNDLALLSAMKSFFENVRSKNIRVILALLTQKLAAQLICVGKQGIIPRGGFVYVFIGSFSDNWWQTEGSSCNLTDADVQSVIVVSGNLINQNSSAVLPSGKTVHDFKEEYVRRQNTWCDVTRYEYERIDLAAGSVYDAVWAVALALDENINLIDMALQQDLQYDHDTLKAIVGTLKEINFTGVTGQVQFMETERVGAESVHQIQNGLQMTLGLYQEGELHLTQDFVWNGSSDSTPSGDVRVDPQGVDIYWIVLGSLVTTLGMVFAIVMWGCNCYYSKHRILRASSQKLNYVIIVGVMFGFLTVILLTILESPLGSVMDVQTFKALCLIRIWMLTLSFTFTYGILFARAWRIYRVFNNPWAASRPYKDYHLMLMVLAVAAVDLMILIPWAIVDPYRRFPVLTDVDYESFSRCVFSSCSSDNVSVWLAVVAIYKIAIIMGGILIISLVRKEVVERKIFDDSRSLALAVYITALAFIVGLPLTFLFLLANRVVLAYIASATWVNVSSWATLLTVFMPKIYKIVIKKDSGYSYRTASKLYYGRAFSTTQTATYYNTKIVNTEAVTADMNSVGAIIEGTDV